MSTQVQNGRSWLGGALVAFSLVVTGCGGDDAKQLFPDGGSGSAGVGGSSGNAGSSGTAGNGGHSGNAGTGATDGGAGCTSDAQCGAQKCEVVSGRCVDCLAPTDCPKSGDRCENNTCVTPTTCQSSRDCTPPEVCDTTTGACVACVVAQDCPANNDCIEQRCVPFQSCTNSRDCSGGTVCDVAAGRCVECVDTPDCGADKVCAGNVCRPGCVSDRQCTPLGLLCDKPKGYCVACLGDGDCSASQYCAAGICKSDVCAAGAQRCTGTTVETCNAAGSAWAVSDRCTSRETCSQQGATATCAPWVCEPSVVACDAGAETVRECAADGLSSTVTDDCGARSQVCVAGECKPAVCSAGARFCQGQEVRTCSAKGDASTLTSTCSALQYCDAAAVPVSCKAKICTDNQPTCDGNFRTTCNANGSGYTGPKVDCGALYCVNGTCQSQVCTPNSRFCDAGDVKQCAANGLSSTIAVDCTSTQYCDTASVTCRAQMCTPGALVCNGNTATTCNADGSGYVAGGTVCSATQTCVTGTCQNHICTPNDVFCDAASGDARRCASNGLSSTLSADCTSTQWCDDSPATAVCRAQVCTPNQPACNGNVATTCNANGSGYTGGSSTCTSSQSCVAGNCEDQICTPNALYCLNEDVHRCSANGVTSSIYSNCSSTQWCETISSTNAACRAQVCTPNQLGCNGNSVATCNANGSGFTSAGTPCGTQTCSGGACIDALFSETWEDLDTVGWSTFGTATYARNVTATGGAGGSNAFLTQTRTSGSGYSDGLVRTFSALTPTSISWWARSGSTSQIGAFTRMFSDTAGSNYLVWHYFNNDGNTTLYQASGSVVVPYAANTWVRFEMRNINWTARTFDYYVDGMLRRTGALLQTSGNSLGRFEMANFDANVACGWDQIEFK